MSSTNEQQPELPTSEVPSTADKDDLPEQTRNDSTVQGPPTAPSVQQATPQATQSITATTQISPSTGFDGTTDPSTTSGQSTAGPSQPHTGDGLTSAGDNRGPEARRREFELTNKGVHAKMNMPGKKDEK